MSQHGNSMPREFFQIDITSYNYSYHALYKQASSKMNELVEIVIILRIIRKALQFEYKNIQLSMRLK